MRHVISVLVQDHPRVLNRITSLFARRGFNLESLAVGTTHVPGLSRICLVVSGDDRTLEQVEKQLNRLIEVLKVTDHTEPHVERELCLVKVHVAGLEERLAAAVDNGRECGETAPGIVAGDAAAELLALGDGLAVAGLLGGDPGRARRLVSQAVLRTLPGACRRG